MEMATSTWRTRYDRICEVIAKKLTFALLTGVDVVGFDDHGAESRTAPPLVFGYADFEPADRKRRDFYPVKSTDFPATALGNASLELVDLFGSGLPDILEMSGTAVRYWRNRGAGHFAGAHAMSCRTRSPPGSPRR
jgi:hypothetical protein